MFYIPLIIYIVAVLACFNSNKTYPKYLFGILVVYLGLRYNTGTDQYSYLAIYNQIIAKLISPLPNYNLGGVQVIGNADYLGQDSIEPGYWLINLIAYKLNGGMLLVNTISAIIMVACYIQFFRQQSSFVIALVSSSFILFFLGIHFTRFSIAISLITCGISYLIKGDDKKYFIFVLLAMLFHYPSIMMMFLLKANSSEKAFYKTIWFRWITIGLLLVLSISIISKFAAYFTGWGDASFYKPFDILHICLILVSLVFFMVYRKNFHSYNETTYQIIKLSGIAFVMVLVFLYPFKALMASRIMYYFDFIQPLVFCGLFSFISENKRRKYVLGVITIYGIYVASLFLFTQEYQYSNILFHLFK